MPPLQPFVSNVPLVVAKNLRFPDANGIPVTQMLPIGMNGTTVADSPTTGYISRIGAVLSQQIDLYNDVQATLQAYNEDIVALQQAVAALELSGTTIPNVNGFCFTGDAQSPITTVVEMIAENSCDYNTALGTTSEIMAAIIAEGAATLNVLPSYSIAGGQMQALTNWEPDPKNLAASVANLWTSYLDARAALTKMQDFITPSCSNNIVDFATNYVTGGSSGIFVYFSGYSFITPAYTDIGSTITITDGVGGIYTTGIDLVARSQPGTDPLFVGISGTPLNTTVGCYQVLLKSVLKSSTNNCTKDVIHTTCERNCQDCSGYRTGDYSTPSFNGTVTIATGLPWVAGYANIVAIDNASALILQQGYFISININTGDITVDFLVGSGQNLNIKWVAFKPTS